MDAPYLSTNLKVFLGVVLCILLVMSAALIRSIVMEYGKDSSKRNGE